MQTGPEQNPRVESWLRIEASIREASLRAQKLLPLLGICLASAAALVVGTQLILFVGGVMASGIYVLHPKETENWLKQHQFLFAGSALGYFWGGGVIGLVLGAWLGYFANQLYNQITDMANRVVVATNPFLHPIDYVGGKISALGHWLRHTVIGSSSLAAEQNSEVNVEYALVSSVSPLQAPPNLHLNESLFNRLSEFVARETNILIPTLSALLTQQPISSPPALLSQQSPLPLVPQIENPSPWRWQIPNSLNPLFHLRRKDPNLLPNASAKSPEKKEEQKVTGKELVVASPQPVIFNQRNLQPTCSLNSFMFNPTQLFLDTFSVFRPRPKRNY